MNSVTLITVTEIGYLITVSKFGYLISQWTRLLNYSQWTRLLSRAPTKKFTATFVFLTDPSGNAIYNDPITGMHKLSKNQKPRQNCSLQEDGTQRYFHPEDTQTLSETVQNLFTTATWHPDYVHSYPVPAAEKTQR